MRRVSKLSETQFQSQMHDLGWGSVANRPGNGAANSGVGRRKVRLVEGTEHFPAEAAP